MLSSVTGFVQRFTRPQNETQDYALIPSSTTSLTSPTSATLPIHRRKRPLRKLRFTPRRVFCVLFAVPVLLALGVLWSGVPPLYEDVERYEKMLPQHKWAEVEAVRGRKNETKRQGAGGEMFLRFPDHIWGHGFNNVLQEYLLTSYIAHTSGRTFVFEDYVWSHLPFPYTIYDFALRNARIPLNAFIAGPTAGATTSSGQHAAVSAKYFAAACPDAEVTVLSASEAPRHANGVELVAWWRDRIRMLNEKGVRCVVVKESGEGEKKVVDRYFFGSSRILNLWPEFSQSPILTEFAWSPLVTSAIMRNFWLFPPGPAAPAAPAEQAVSERANASAPHEIIPNLVAVHLRRGDYKRHCPRLFNWGTTYMGLNTFPGLPDTFDRTTFNVSYIPAGTSDPDEMMVDPTSPPEERERLKSYYLQHCLPTIPQLVARLHEVRLAHPGLRRVYILSNAWPSFLSELKAELRGDGWGEVGNSYDLVLDGEQRGVDATVDMGVAERAEVFLGNGFSSLTANIVMLRIAKGMDVKSNRFL